MTLGLSLSSASVKAKGAPGTCYCLSGSDELDGREMPLAAALEEVVSHDMGTFISCLPGRLAHFQR